MSLSLTELIRRIQVEKNQITACQGKIAEFEKEIVDLVGSEDEGSRSVDTDDGLYKVTTTQPIKREIDLDRLAEVWKDLGPSSPFEAVSTPKLDLKKLRKLAETDRKIYDLANSALVLKPGKISVKIKSLEDK